jgi:hypothetical protein
METFKEFQIFGAKKAKWLITCARLHADYVGHMAKGAKGPAILPFRGSYQELKPKYRSIIKRNILVRHILSKLNDTWFGRKVFMKVTISCGHPFVKHF